MSEGTTEDTAAEPALRTLADKVNWLIDRARPAGRGPYTNAELAALIERTTGEKVSYTTVWKLRNGQAANPQMKLTGAIARTSGVPPGFFFADYDTGQAGLLQEEAEVLALVRSASIRHCSAPPDPGAAPGGPPGDHRPHRRRHRCTINPAPRTRTRCPPAPGARPSRPHPALPGAGAG